MKEELDEYGERGCFLGNGILRVNIWRYILFLF